MEHLSHLVGAYSRIIHLDCLFAYLFRILSPLCFRRICLFAMSADIPLRSAARESHLPLLCCCSAFRAFLLFLFHTSIISLLHTFCQLPNIFHDFLRRRTHFVHFHGNGFFRLGFFAFSSPRSRPNGGAKFARKKNEAIDCAVRRIFFIIFLK